MELFTFFLIKKEKFPSRLRQDRWICRANAQIPELLVQPSCGIAPGASASKSKKVNETFFDKQANFARSRRQYSLLL